MAYDGCCKVLVMRRMVRAWHAVSGISFWIFTFVLTASLWNPCAVAVTVQAGLRKLDPVAVDVDLFQSAKIVPTCLIRLTVYFLFGFTNPWYHSIQCFDTDMQYNGFFTAVRKISARGKLRFHTESGLNADPHRSGFWNPMYGSLWQTAKSWLGSAHCCKKGLIAQILAKHKILANKEVARVQLFLSKILQNWLLITINFTSIWYSLYFPTLPSYTVVEWYLMVR